MQRGIGFHTLCNSCNSNTGGWYGNAFIDFIFQGYKQLIKVEQSKTIELHYKGIFPNRIIKQILAMFCSINSDAFVAANPIFKKVLLNKLQTGIPLDKYAIYIYVLTGSVKRYLGTCGILNVFKQGKSRIVSELSSPPYGFILEFDPPNDSLQINIADWFNVFQYDQKTDIVLQVPILECNTQFPLDYRTKQEILRSYLQGKLFKMNNIPPFGK